MKQPVKTPKLHSLAQLYHLLMPVILTIVAAASREFKEKEQYTKTVKSYQNRRLVIGNFETLLQLPST